MERLRESLPTYFSSWKRLFRMGGRVKGAATAYFIRRRRDTKSSLIKTCFTAPFIPGTFCPVWPNCRPIIIKLPNPPRPNLYTMRGGALSSLNASSPSENRLHSLLVRHLIKLKVILRKILDAFKRIKRLRQVLLSCSFRFGPHFDKQKELSSQNKVQKK